MENKIDIVELLKGCPKGMELDCTMYDNVSLLSVNDGIKDFPIRVVREDGNSIALTKYGQYTKAGFAKCVIYPKGKTTWEGFIPPFKDGDVIACTNRSCTFVAIYKHMGGEDAFYRYACLILDEGMHFSPNCSWSDFANPRFATEDEKEKLFKAIKDNGYRWNPETKTLEKLIESKEDTDDRIVMSGIYFDRENYADEVELHLGNYEIEIRDGKTYAVFKNQETKTLKPKFKVGDKIKLKGGDEFGIITQVADCFYIINCKNHTHYWSIIKQDDWELVPVVPKFKVGDKIKKKGDTRLITINDVRDDYYIIKILDYFGNCYITDKISFSNQCDYELVPTKFDISNYERRFCTI